MKKLLSIFALCLCVTLAAHAQYPQQSGNLLSRYGKTLDTVTNTGVKNLTSGRITGAGQNVTVGIATTNLTGTQAGVARLFGSLDNIHFTRVRAPLLHGQGVDSLKIDVNTLNYHWVVDNSPFTYYQLQITGVGTVTFTTQAFFVKH